MNTGPGSGPLKTNLERHFEKVQLLTGERGSKIKRNSAITYGERHIKTPKVSTKHVHVFSRLKTKVTNQTAERFACQTDQHTCCKKVQSAVRMFRGRDGGSRAKN